MADDEEVVRALGRRAARDGVEARRLEAEVRARLFGTPAPEATIGPYTLVSRLGQGGMGTVHLARGSDGRLVALKTVLTSDERTLARVRREARALRELDHPHVVAIEADGTFAEGVWVAMEYVDGPTLRRALRGEPWHAVLDALLPIADALAAAHAIGLVHRDVKPDNMLRGADGISKLVDFGLAKALPGTEAGEHPTLGDPLTRTGAAVGTIGYAAPEQLLGREVDGRADQFAWCASLYEMLWGKLPFSGATADAIGLAAMGGRIDAPPPSDVPDRVLAAIRQGLAPDPARRHASMSALRTALARPP